MAVNKVVYGTETLIDLTDDTATEVDVASGKKFHLANGVQATGTASVGGTQNTWYGTCPTGATSQTKVVTTSSGDFSLATGSMVRVKFTNAQTYNGGIKLNVDGTGAHNVMRQGTTSTVRYFYLAGEVVDFVYDGTNYIAVNEGIATTTYYGVTKLSSATNSTSTAMAATPAAVKEAYDLASSKQDALVSGTNIKTINGESILGSGDIAVGGGGGGNFFTAYTKHNDAYLYADSECTQRLIDAYEDDYAALWGDLKSADSVRIIEDDPSDTSVRYVFVASCIKYDKIEPEIVIYYIRGMGIGQYNA